jgi:FXSXX-COOH protein
VRLTVDVDTGLPDLTDVDLDRIPDLPEALRRVLAALLDRGDGDVVMFQNSV